MIQAHGWRNWEWVGLRTRRSRVRFPPAQKAKARGAGSIDCGKNMGWQLRLTSSHPLGGLGLGFQGPLDSAKSPPHRPSYSQESGKSSWLLCKLGWVGRCPVLDSWKEDCIGNSASPKHRRPLGPAHSAPDAQSLNFLANNLQIDANNK